MSSSCLLSLCNLPPSSLHPTFDMTYRAHSASQAHCIYAPFCCRTIGFAIATLRNRLILHYTQTSQLDLEVESNRLSECWVRLNRSMGGLSRDHPIGTSAFVTQFYNGCPTWFVSIHTSRWTTIVRRLSLDDVFECTLCHCAPILPWSHNIVTIVWLYQTLVWRLPDLASSDSRIMCSEVGLEVRQGELGRLRSDCVWLPSDWYVAMLEECMVCHHSRSVIVFHGSWRLWCSSRIFGSRIAWSATLQREGSGSHRLCGGHAMFDGA